MIRIARVQTDLCRLFFWLRAVTPERLSSAAFKKRLAVIHKQRELNRLVVDEAHCISECKKYNV